MSVHFFCRADRACRSRYNAGHPVRRAGRVILGLSVLFGLTGATWAQRPLGVDVSKWQASINWQQVYNSGRVFAFIKASQGTTVTDGWFLTNIVNARNAGLLVGPYHFADPLNKRQPEDGHTAVDEANYFLSVAGNYMVSGYLPPVLDVEACAEMGKTTLSAWVKDFCDHVQEVKGVRPIVYTSYNYATNYLNSTVTESDLWLAYWDYGNPQTANPPSGVWPTWTFWQYTVAPAGTVPGISTDIDLDVFNGTLAQLQEYVIGDPGTIVVAPTSLSTTVRAGRTMPDQTFTVSITGGATWAYGITADVSWLEVNPSSGTSGGESDTITVQYILDGLPIDTHQGNITVAAGGTTNSPVVLPITLDIQPVPGDLDRDGDIDAGDVTLFHNCMTPPTSQVPLELPPACISADFDGDSDVDVSDFGIQQVCLSGPAVPADPNCAP